MANDKVSMRRIMAMATALGLHLMLLAVVLRPASSRMAFVPSTTEAANALHLRLITLQRPPSHSVPALSPPSSQPRSHPARVVPARRDTALPRPKPVAQTVALQPPAEAPTDTTSPTTGTAPPSAYDDGGFQQRLQEAQHGQSVRGIPGSAARLAPGIQLTDPRKQGIGAVMRSAQRLFGVTSKHCIDVEAWSKLSPEELIARHLTPADVKAANERYECNRPLGLSF